MTSSATEHRVRRAAHDVFGHADLLPGQLEATTALLEGHDVLLISPTGAGKSLTYQLAGTILERLTLVVSPLLALQQDQVDHLDALRGDVRAARLSSAESATRREEVLAAAEAGELDFLFLAPEQLALDDVRRRLAVARPGLVAVDEAHCVSAWGHDFRPDYHRLGALLDELGDREASPSGRPRVVAMTATAAPPVREEIAERLELRDPRLVVTDFARDNLVLDVVRVAGEDEQERAVLDAALAVPADAAGIVYCRTRPATARYVELLRADERLGDRTVEAYHAGLAHRRRRETQEAFLGGAVDIVVATSAFGMGIDKPDVRFVVHAHAPESPDTYYQEAGRAGRDGADATATLVHREEDLALGRFFSATVPSRGDLRKARAALDALDTARAEGDADVADLDPVELVGERVGCGRRKAGRLVNLLRDAEDSGRGTGVDGARELATRRRDLERSRVELVRHYAETDRCRSQVLVEYLGEQLAGPCGRCDTCRAGVVPDAVDPDEVGYRLQEQVHHPEFGDGVVTELEADRVTVLFGSVGYRTLALDVVRDHDLLAAG
ncbi:RecQ family ATP-dependent DNA helicase [Nocardioides sp. Leaf374]|uniref:RecQ family ATP-dependent DNA helicase n=1 Tax=Nocardioides sp. Leaf374 TaxID=2876560 RepID=UPI001E353A35|nr:RecQ family ATP-dependent DNA helicase [Nocardioides sp. Leaf374]